MHLRPNEGKWETASLALSKPGVVEYDFITIEGLVRNVGVVGHQFLTLQNVEIPESSVNKMKCFVSISVTPTESHSKHVQL